MQYIIALYQPALLAIAALIAIHYTSKRADAYIRALEQGWDPSLLAKLKRRHRFAQYVVGAKKTT